MCTELFSIISRSAINPSKTAIFGTNRQKPPGYDIVSMGLPSFESQEDRDRYHPDDAGQDFRELN